MLPVGDNRLRIKVFVRGPSVETPPNYSSAVGGRAGPKPDLRSQFETLSVVGNDVSWPSPPNYIGGHVTEQQARVARQSRE
jgi:hypothetical protein